MNSHSCIELTPALALCAICAFPCFANQVQQSARPVQNHPAQEMESRHTASAATTLPSESTNRYNADLAKLQPSAKAWVAEQAELQGHRASPGVSEIRQAAQARFSNQEGLAQMDVDELVFLVLVQAASAQNNELERIRNEVQAQTKAKQSLREMIAQIDTAQRSIGATGTPESQAKPGASGLPSAGCSTEDCAAVAAQSQEIVRSTAQAAHPLHYAVPSNPTRQQLAQLRATANGDLNSLSDMSEQMQMKLQMAQQQYDQFMQVISNMMKSMSDTSSAVISNLK